MKIKEKILGVLLSICLVLSLIPATVFAAEMKDFSFYVVDNYDTSTILTGAKGTLTVVRNNEVIVTAELQEGKDESGYSIYTAQLDAAVVTGTDELYATIYCDGYYSLEEDSIYGASFGDLSSWIENDYTLVYPENFVGLEPWDESIRQLNEAYEVFEVTDENGTVSEVILNYYGTWNEATFTEALSYVVKDEKLTVVIDAGENELPALSSALMTQLSAYDYVLYFQSDDVYAEFYGLDCASSLEVVMGDASNDSVEKKLKNAGITSGYLAYSFIGEGSFESSYVEHKIPTALEGNLIVPEENKEAYEDGISVYGEAEKYLYYYDAESNLFVPSAKNVVYYYEKGDFASEDQDFYGINFDEAIDKFGHYIVCETKLPAAITTESMVEVETNASMTTEKVTEELKTAIEAAEEGETVQIGLTASQNIGEAALQAAVDSKIPVVIVVEETEKNSYVSWQFETVDNPVEFNPTVQVDATVEAVNTKLATVELPASLKYTTVSFAFAGKLPGAAEVTLDIKGSDLGLVNTAEGVVVYLYYYNPTTNIFELIDTSAVTDGYASFNMTHCSDYIVATEKLPEAATKVVDNSNSQNVVNNQNATNTQNASTTDKSSPKTGDNSLSGTYTVLLTFAVVIVSIITKKRTGWKNYEKRGTIS